MGKFRRAKILVNDVQFANIFPHKYSEITEDLPEDSPSLKYVRQTRKWVYVDFIAKMTTIYLWRIGA